MRECEEEANREDRGTIEGAVADIPKAEMSSHGAIFSLFFSVLFCGEEEEGQKKDKDKGEETREKERRTCSSCRSLNHNSASN